MKPFMKKIGVAIGALIIISFLSYTMTYFYLQHIYKQYSHNFEVTIKNLSYHKVDNTTDLLANVKFPGFGTLTGNLAISTPDNKFAIIIWPKVIGRPEVGLQSYITDPSKHEESFLIVDNGSIDLSHSSLPKETQTIVLKLEEEAKLLWGDDILKKR